MHILSRDRQIQAIAALCEGVSIRATERLVGVNRQTVMRLGARVGKGCAKLHDGLMRNLHVDRCELDEAWSFVGKKEKKLKPEDGADKGDQYIFLAMAGVAKAIVSYRVGKRDQENTTAFAADLRERVLGQPEISSDGWTCYPEAIDEAFGLDVKFGQIVKNYGGQSGAVEAARRYSPAQVVSVTRRAVVGRPKHISTSFIERQNLTLRMQQRRFTRLTNAFSKKLENHEAAVALYVAHFNLCRVHETLRITPAMQLGVTDHVWSIGELIDAALDGELPPDAGREFPANLPPPKPKGWKTFTVIRGGKGE